LRTVPPQEAGSGGTENTTVPSRCRTSAAQPWPAYSGTCADTAQPATNASRRPGIDSHCGVSPGHRTRSRYPTVAPESSVTVREAVSTAVAAWGSSSTPPGTTVCTGRSYRPIRAPAPAA